MFIPTSANSYRHETVHIYASNDFPPYEFVDEKGKAEGFNIDVIREVMNDTGLPYDITVTNWKSVLKAYKEGKADIILGMSYSKERTKNFKFGMSYTSLFQSVVFRKDSKPYKSIAMLKNKKVMIDKGDILEDIAISEGLNKEIIPMDNISKGLHLLSEGKVDAVLCSREVALYIIKEDDIKNLELNDLPIPPLEYGYAGKDRRLLNDMDNALIKVKNDGILENLFRKWFYYDNSKKVIIIIITATSILLICCIIFFFFLFMLRRRVEKSKRIIGIQSQRMKLAFRAGGVSVWGYDIKKKIFFNIECDYFNRNGSSFEDTLMMICPDDRKIFSDTIENLSKPENQPNTLLIRAKMNNGDDYRFMQTEFTQTLDDFGNVETIIGSYRDVTEERKKNEEMRLFTEKMNYVLESSSIIIWEYNIKTHIITLYNGINSIVKSIHCNDYFNLLNENDREGAVTLFKTMDKGEAKPFSNIRKISESVFGKRDVYAMFNGIPLFDENNNVISYFGLRRDVTDFINIQHKLKEETSKAMVADKLKSAFLANMSHEIRTPLNAIVGFSNLLQTTDTEKDKELFVKIINTNNELLLNLIDDVLYLSKIESGIMEIKNIDFDLSQTITTLSHSLSQRCNNPNVELLCDNPYKKCIINSDNNRIAQILTNLTTNAIKNTYSGHVKIGYECDESSVTLYVEDTGIGIPKDKREIIFKRFEKLNDFVQGTGLGLSICKAITDSCGGKIWVESEEDKGSTFYVWIPCKIIDVSLKK